MQMNHSGLFRGLAAVATLALVLSTPALAVPNESASARKQITLPAELPSHQVPLQLKGQSVNVQVKLDTGLQARIEKNGFRGLYGEEAVRAFAAEFLQQGVSTGRFDPTALTSGHPVAIVPHDDASTSAVDSQRVDDSATWHCYDVYYYAYTYCTNSGGQWTCWDVYQYDHTECYWY